MILPPSENIRDKIWRVQNLYKILDKKRRMVCLKFNRVQTKIVDDILKMTPIRHFSLKTRQQGVSSFWLLWWLDDTIFRTGTQTGILSHKLESLKYLMEIVRRAYQSMPNHLRIPTIGDNKQELSFKSTNSKIFSSLSIRSTGLHNLHISEICFCKDQEIEATLAAASESTNISYESTGNGVGNHGYQNYQEAKSGESLDGTVARFFPWFIQDEYKMDLKGMAPPALSAEEKKLAALMKRDWNLDLSPEQVLWRRDKVRKLKGIFRQEYPASDDDAFLTSGLKFFNYKKLHQLILEANAYLRVNPPIEETEDYVLWEKPIKGDVYAAGADCSEGAKDFSTLKIINVSKCREVFKYRARVGVNTFYKVCDQWGRYFNNALLGVERNNHGHAVLLGLEEDRDYPNLYKDDRKTRPEENIHIGKQTRALKTQKSGWNTDKVSRPLMLDHLKYAIEGDELDDEDHFTPAYSIFDVELLKECLTFEEVDGKFQAIEGETDDLIFAAGICYQMFQRVSKQIHAGGLSNRIIAVGQREAT